MKTIKIGAVNYTISNWKDVSDFYIKDHIVSGLIHFSKFKYEYVENPYENECDLIFYSTWGDLENLKKCKGSPIFIFWTTEYLNLGTDSIISNMHIESNIDDKQQYEYSKKLFDLYRMNHYSLSFCDDSETNLYYPYWIVEYLFSLHSFSKSLNSNFRNIANKRKFCTFINSHKSYDSTRYDFTKALSSKYKTVTCPGKILHNTGEFVLPYNNDLETLYCGDFKFYISFENGKSLNEFNYITEKIMRGWQHGCVPLYWGDNRIINKFFNKDAYVDLSNMTIDQMIDKVIELDNDNEQCDHIINQYLFSLDHTPNYTYNYFLTRLSNFIENIIINHF